jgi:hypothetical protein
MGQKQRLEEVRMHVAEQSSSSHTRRGWGWRAEEEKAAWGGRSGGTVSAQSAEEKERELCLPLSVNSQPCVAGR